MADRYLKIVKHGPNQGTVANMVMLEESDPKDPAYEWRKLAKDEPHPGIGQAASLQKVAVKTGKGYTFPTFQLSEKSGAFVVSHEEPNIAISCVKFDKKWLREVLTLHVKEKVIKTDLMHAMSEGLYYEKWCIAWPDVKKILETLEGII